MKYMFVIPSLSKGGAERVVSVLASGLAQTDAEVVILRYFKTDADYSVDDKVKVITLSEGYEKDYEKISRFSRFARIAKIFKQEEPDAIIPFLHRVDIQCYISASIKYRKRIIHTLRVSPYNTKGIGKKMHYFLINHTNKSIVQNQSQKDFFKEGSQKRIHILPNPVKSEFLDECVTLDDSRFVAVASGRLLPQKNFPMLIKAFSSFAFDKEGVFLHIYGEGSNKETLQSLIDELGCGEKIKLMGRTNDLVSVYKNVNLFILSSNFEGMPNALLEAMAIGLPCISTDCPTGPSEMIVNGENGLLVPVDDAKKMKEAIEFMYNNRDRAEGMGKCARAYVAENYRVDKIVNKFIEIVDR